MEPGCTKISDIGISHTFFRTADRTIPENYRLVSAYIPPAVREIGDNAWSGLEALDVPDRSPCCTVFRRCITGVNQYRYFQKNPLIGNAAAYVAPHYPVMLTGTERTLYREHNPERTIYPGRCISVLSETQEYARVTYLGNGKHWLQIEM